MQMAAYVEQNFMYTQKAWDLGRGNRSDPVHGIPQFPPGPGRYESNRDFENTGTRGAEFGSNAARVGGVDLRLTALNDIELEKMLDARKGEIGEPTKRFGQEYAGPGQAPVKTSIKPFPTYIGVHVQQKHVEAKEPRKVMDNPGPDRYIIKSQLAGPSFQFGSRFDDKRSFAMTKPGGSRFDSSLRTKPHLKPKKVDGPGPGDYKLQDSVRTKHRSLASTQRCTMGIGRHTAPSPGKRKHKFSLPGPAHYNHVYNDLRTYTKPHQNEGFSFNHGPRDIQKQVNLSKEPPGAGQYNPELPKNQSAMAFQSGPEKKADKHNGVPSPGRHYPKAIDDAPKCSFADPLKRPKTIRDEHEATANLGPGAYKPNHLTHTSKSAAFPMTAKGGKGPAIDDGTELSLRIRNVQKKKRDQVQFMGVPGPQYNIPGDFDFPDPRNPDDLTAPGKKKAKFAFGMKINTRAKNLDMPGPGEYETDIQPMNMSNKDYWIGTDVRKDLGVPYAYMYPGPDHYYPEEMENPGAHVSFPKDPKKCAIEKTNDPGPATYARYSTVGVQPHYQRNGANARVVDLPPHKNEDD